MEILRLFLRLYSSRSWTDRNYLFTISQADTIINPSNRKGKKKIINLVELNFN